MPIWNRQLGETAFMTNSPMKSDPAKPAAPHAAPSPANSHWPARDPSSRPGRPSGQARPSEEISFPFGGFPERGPDDFLGRVAVIRRPPLLFARSALNSRATGVPDVAETIPFGRRVPLPATVQILHDPFVMERDGKERLMAAP